MNDKMVARAVSFMLIIIVLVVVVCNWSPRVAYQVLTHSQNLFEPEAKALVPPKVAMPARVPRGYISPLVKKRVAARQKWRCASCKSLLDETYELDYIDPLWKGGTNAETNLQALCKRCHVLKSAVEQSSRR